MQRRSNDNSSEFYLKNAVEYEVTVGYNLYDGDDYKLDTDSLTSRKRPQYSAESAPLKFYWWNIDGAAGLVASATAIVALQFF